MIIPYISMPITSKEYFETYDSAIDHVYVGPCPHMGLSTRSVDEMLLCNNIEVTVHPSSIPFRAW
jgi:hypothetical protein